MDCIGNLGIGLGLDNNFTKTNPAIQKHYTNNYTSVPQINNHHYMLYFNHSTKSCPQN